MTTPDAESNRDRVVRAILGEPEWPSSLTLKPSLLGHMQALGVLITRYNELEGTLYLLFQHYLNDEHATASKLIFSRLNNQNREDVLRQYAETEKDEKVRNTVQLFMTAFRTCTDNRNFVAHAQIHGGTYSLADLGSFFRLDDKKLTLKKSRKGNPSSENYTHLEITELRQMADDITTTKDFGTELYLYLAIQRMGGSVKMGDETIFSPTLPEVPPPPRALILTAQADHEPSQG